MAPWSLVAAAVVICFGMTAAITFVVVDDEHSRLRRIFEAQALLRMNALALAFYGQIPIIRGIQAALEGTALSSEL